MIPRITKWYIFAGYYDKLASGEQTVQIKVNLVTQKLNKNLPFAVSTTLGHDAKTEEEFLDFSTKTPFAEECADDGTFEAKAIELTKINDIFTLELELKCTAVPKIEDNKDGSAKDPNAVEKKTTTAALVKDEGAVDQQKTAAVTAEKKETTTGTPDEKEIAAKKETEIPKQELPKDQGQGTEDKLICLN